MTRFFATVIAMILFICLMMPWPARADTGCVINVLGVRVCGELLSPLPTVTVAPPTVVLPGSTITVRLPSQTVTVPGPVGPTVTVTAPGQPGATVTEIVPGPTSTITASQPTATKTIGPGAVSEPPTPTSVPAQDRPVKFFSGDIHPFDNKITVAEVGLGIVATLILMGLFLVGMYAGYVMGYKDKERKDTHFMRSLLDSIKVRGRP
jgi:hypothetical protein